MDSSKQPDSNIVEQVKADIVPTSDLGRLMAVIEQGGRTADEMTRLYDLMERMQDRQAEGEFVRALAQFQADCPKIVKRHENAQFMVTRNGVEVPAKFANLEDIATTIGPKLAEHGLSYRWGDAVIDGELLTQACILSHTSGHSVSARSLPIPINDPRNNKPTPQQKIAIASTYARRYSLIAVLGLTTCDEDDDGAGSGGEPPVPLDEHQIMAIDDALHALAEARRSTPDAQRTKLLAWLKVERVAEIPAKRFSQLLVDLDKWTKDAQK